MSKEPTLHDVAQAASVSVATVSRIVNGRSGYSSETRTAVEEVIRRLGYRPNGVARGLVSRRTRTIAVLLPDVCTRFAALLLRGIEATAHEGRHSVIVCNTGSDGRRTLETLELLGERRPDGIVFTSEWVRDDYAQAFHRMRTPVVLVSTFSQKHQLPYVRVDDHSAAYSATVYLIEHGHRRIGMVAGTATDRVAGRPRVEGFLAACADHGIETDETHVTYGDFAYASGVRAAQDLLVRHPDLTAVFAASDEMAVGVLTHAFRSGIRVPEQLSVVGYDDTLDAIMSVPPLTTVHQPITEFGNQAVRMLLDPQMRSQSVILPHHIVERGTVGTLSPPGSI